MKFELFGRFKAKKNAKNVSSSLSSHDQNAMDSKQTFSDNESMSKNSDFDRHQKTGVAQSSGIDYKDIDRSMTNSIKDAVLNESHLPSTQAQQNIIQDPQNNQDDTLFYNEDFTQGLSGMDENSITTNSATRFGTPKEDLRPLTYEVEQQTPDIDESSEEYELFMEEVEEVVDSILSKKYTKFEDLKNELNGQISELSDRFDNIENAIDELNARFKDLELNINKKVSVIKAQQEALLPQIEGIEKAFKDIIPNIVDSIKELQESVNKQQPQRVHSHSSNSADTDDLDTILQKDLKEIKNSQNFSRQKRVVVEENKDKSKDNKNSKKDKSGKKSDKNEIIDDFDYTELIS